MSHKDGALHHHFDNLHQQKTSVTLGMWLFLATEILFFGTLFTVYVFYRNAYPEAFAAASHHLDVTWGTINTAVLIGSSLTMALAVHAGQRGNQKAIKWFVIATMVLGSIFLAVKAQEYHHKWQDHLVPGANFAFDAAHERPAHIFFLLYFVMTGLHATHMVIGMVIMMFLLHWNRQGRFTKAYSAPVEVAGLYWHFVDIAWIFIFPLLYLIGRH